MTEKYVSISELAEHLSVSIPTIRLWIGNGILPSDCCLKVARTYRFKISEVESALKKEKLDKEVPIEYTNDMADMDF
tara:strand:- start:56 stop:286 length:231 start_codon:yes stop_codon:yes gene_type:complete